MTALRWVERVTPDPFNSELLRVERVLQQGEIGSWLNESGQICSGLVWADVPLEVEQAA